VYEPRLLPVDPLRVLAPGAPDALLLLDDALRLLLSSVDEPRRLLD